TSPLSASILLKTYLLAIEGEHMAPSSGSSTDTGRRRASGWRSSLTLQGRGRWGIAFALSAASALVAMTLTAVASAPQASARPGGSAAAQNQGNSATLVSQGQQTFRFDTFGDEAFWGGTLHLNQAIAGAKNGGVGPGLSPKAALAAGLKVDVDALPESLQDPIQARKVHPNHPATTLAPL